MDDLGRDEDEHDANRDEFLLHLSRGAEYLRDARVHESKEELERALRLRPTDPHSQDMLAQVYYRLGVYPRAVELYRDLLLQYPDSPALYVNLALVHLKTGQPYEAQGLLSEAVRLDPDHGRAWGYLGLVQARIGRYVEARESFLRSGHASMAQRMDQIIQGGRPSAPDARANAQIAARPTASEGGERAPRLPHPERGEGRGEGRALGELPISLVLAESFGESPTSAVVQGALERLEPNEPFEPRVETPRRRPSGTELQRPGLPPRPIGPAFLGADVPTIADWLVHSALAFPAPGTVVVDSDGNALAQLGDPALIGERGGVLAVRESGLRATLGGIRGDPLSRLARTAGVEGLLGGGDDPLVALQGPAQIVLRAPPGARLTVVRVGNESLFVRESALYAMSGGIRHESAAIEMPGSTGRVLVTHLVGPGVLALRTARVPRAIALSGNQPLRVAADAVVGWSGRVFPSRADSQGFSALVTLAGEGAVIVQ
ncbi:MAG: tetratricopeptide repeat protein [Deltaproteobacteria bacterium]|nr:tetratricopeptide repeat protein [Deltaproteobacteria bacterium]